MKQWKILLIILAVGIIIAVGSVIYLKKPITSDADEDTYYIEEETLGTDMDIHSETYVPTEK